MPLPGAGAENFATGGYFEPFGHCFSGLNPFWTSHKVDYFLKRARNIGSPTGRRKRLFRKISLSGGESPWSGAAIQAEKSPRRPPRGFWSLLVLPSGVVLSAFFVDSALENLVRLRANRRPARKRGLV